MAAAVSIRCVRVAAATAGGNQDITISGFGTPKAALFIVTSAVSDNTATAHASLSIGATDGTNQWVNTIRDDDGVAAAAMRTRGATDEVIMCINGSGTVLAEANFNAWITDGVRITWGVTPPVASLITVVLFTGTDLSAKVDTLTPSGTETTYSSMGFEADLVLTTNSRSAMNDAAATNGGLHFGAVANTKSAVTACDVGQLSANAAADAAIISTLATYTAAPYVLDGASVFTGSWHVYGFTSTGFVHKNMGSTVGGVGILGLKIANGGVWVGGMDPPVATGSKTFYGPPFTPVFMGIALSSVTAVDAINSSGDAAGSLGISVLTASEQFCNTICSEDAAATMNTQSLADDQAVNIPASNGSSTLHAATLTGFVNGGVTLNFATAGATQRRWWGFAIGDDPVIAAAGGGGVLVPGGMSGGFRA